MDKNITTYNFQDLIEEQSFRSWVIDNDVDNALLWKNKIAEHPEIEKIMFFAKSFLIALNEPIILHNQEELDLITTNILSKTKISETENIKH
jgi:hypothetical protein